MQRVLVNINFTILPKQLFCDDVALEFGPSMRLIIEGVHFYFYFYPLGPSLHSNVASAQGRVTIPMVAIDPHSFELRVGWIHKKLFKKSLKDYT